MTPSGIESATFRFVVQHLNHCNFAWANNKIWSLDVIFAYSSNRIDETGSSILLQTAMNMDYVTSEKM